jgi:hypothetical protein
MKERQRIEALRKELDAQPRYSFPKERGVSEAPNTQGVYVIFEPRGAAAHVGRTVRGRAGLRQRLRNHLRGQSSFARTFLGGRGEKLRKGFKFQFLVVPNDRERALLEYAATVWHCPKHLGLGAL